MDIEIVTDKFTNKEIINIIQKDSCIICIEEYSPDSIKKQMSCGHNFHEDCITQWVSKSNTCPVCRTSFNEENDLIAIPLTISRTPISPNSTERDQREVRNINKRLYLMVYLLIIFILFIFFVIFILIYSENYVVNFENNISVKIIISVFIFIFFAILVYFIVVYRSL